MKSPNIIPVTADENTKTECRKPNTYPRCPFRRAIDADPEAEAMTTIKIKNSKQINADSRKDNGVNLDLVL